MDKDKMRQMTAALEQSLAVQGRLHGVEREPVQQEILIYALEELNPVSHTEFALTVWFGTRYEPAQDMVHEYCLRRAGLPIMQFNHPLLSLQGWCMPDTYRFLVFREQLEALARQLTGLSDGHRVVRGIYRFGGPSDGISLDEFRGMIDLDNGLVEGEISSFYGYLKEQYGKSLPYAWCSTIVERAKLPSYN